MRINLIAGHLKMFNKIKMQDMGGHLKIIDNSKQEMTTLSTAL